MNFRVYHPYVCTFCLLPSSASLAGFIARARQMTAVVPELDHDEVSRLQRPQRHDPIFPSRTYEGNDRPPAA